MVVDIGLKILEINDNYEFKFRGSEGFMKKVRIEEAKEGQVLAKPLLNTKGVLILRDGIILTSYLLRRLRGLGYKFLYIEDTKKTESKNCISEKARKQAIACLREIEERIRYGSSFSLAPVKEAVSSIISDVVNNKDFIVHLTNIDSHDEYTFNHCINVTALSIIIGRTLKYTDSRLLQLGLSVFLHDVGKIFIPPAILNKPHKLSENEFELIKQHTWHGFYLLSTSSDIPVELANVALQHHEKYDGSGYLQNLKGHEISEFARICTVADVFDALTNSRPYREKLPPNKVFEYLLKNTGKYFDPMIMELFMKNVKLCPEGMIVSLKKNVQIQFAQ